MKFQIILGKELSTAFQFNKLDFKNQFNSGDKIIDTIFAEIQTEG